MENKEQIHLEGLEDSGKTVLNLAEEDSMKKYLKILHNFSIWMDNRDLEM